jgi:hypothetical protein
VNDDVKAQASSIPPCVDADIKLTTGADLALTSFYGRRRWLGDGLRPFRGVVA